MPAKARAPRPLTQRVQVVLPTKIAEMLRKEVPARQRSAFVAECLEERLLIVKRKRLLARETPIWPDKDFPHLNTTSDTLAYLDAIRTGKDPAKVLKARYDALGFTSLAQVDVFRNALRKGMSEREALRVALPATVAGRRRKSA
ncbi:MAG TPA: hypothetical protein VJP07_00695 [Dehalococcoidia bacterium]|nr:hypothetical protein [Dehalococcoidia bacterium]